MGHPKNILFSRIENLNIENYHDTKKLTVSQKIPLTWSISLHMVKMSTFPQTLPKVFEKKNTSLPTPHFIQFLLNKQYFQTH